MMKYFPLFLNRFHGIHLRYLRVQPAGALNLTISSLIALLKILKRDLLLVKCWNIPSLNKFLPIRRW